MKVKADQYMGMKKHHEEMQKKFGMDMPFDAIPVDLNGAYVPFEKDAEGNLEKASQCNLDRFGLNEPGEEGY